MTADTQSFPDSILRVGEVFRADENGRPYTEPRRLHGLRFPVLPSGAWLAQVLGGIAVLCGMFLIWGVAVTLIAGGGAAMVLGTLHEAGMLKPGEAGKTGG